MSHRGQHFIECARCTKYSKFYCNDCHQQMCEQHKDIHIREDKNTKHDVVLYQERIQELPTENCPIHPKRDLEIYCKECLLPICSKCFTTSHNSHQVLDLEVIYNEYLQQHKIELIKLRGTILPQAVEKLSSWRDRRETLKEKIAKIRISMKKSAEEVKAAVDTILAEGNSKLDKMEISIRNEMNGKEKETEEYIVYLKSLVKKYESGTLLSKPSDVFTFSKEIADIPSMKISDTTEPVLPDFILGTIAKNELERQIGKLRQCDPKTPNNEEKPILQTLQPRMMLTSSIRKIEEIALPQITSVRHLSFSPFKSVWVIGRTNPPDSVQNMPFHYDLQGNLLQEFLIGGWFSEYYTVTLEGELLFTHTNRKAICRLSENMTKSTLITTYDGTAGDIYSSHINGDILVGVYKDGKQKVIRYNKTGKKLQEIQKDDNGQDLFCIISYITENINGDICVSERKVVVVTRLGQYRFSYLGHPSQPGFYPLRICTDALGIILVCGGGSNNEPCGIHMLDQDGQFLNFLITSQKPSAFCTDDKQNVWVGTYNSPIVKVYKYLEKIDI